MSLFNFGWEQVYFTMNYAEFLAKQNRLREAGIDFRTKIENNSLRISMNNIRGTNAALSRGGPPVKDYYKLLVRKEDLDYAEHILNKK